MPENPVSTRRRRHILQLAAIFGLTLAVTAGTMLARKWPFTREKVAESLQETIPGVIRFRTFRATYFPHPGCVAEDVTFTRRGSTPDSPPLYTIRRITIQVGYLDLFSRPAYIARVLLEGLRVRIPPRPAGAQEQPFETGLTLRSTRFGEIQADGAILEIARKDEREPLLFEIHNLTLNSVRQDAATSYRVAFHNPLPPGEIVSSGRIGPWKSGDLGETPVAGSYVFDSADLGVFPDIAGLLSSKGEFSDALGHIDSAGSIEIPNFSVTRSGHRLSLKAQFHATVSGTNGDVHLQEVQAVFLRTVVSAKGSIASSPGQQGKTTSIDLMVNEGLIQDVLRMFVQEVRPPLSGTTSFRAHVTIPPERRPFLEKIRLTGDFGVAEGQFSKVDTQGKVNELSVRAGGGQQQQQDADDLPNVISNLSGHVALQNGAALLSDLSFAIPNALAQMHGTYNLLNQRIDMHGTLKTDAQFTKVAGGGVKSFFLKPFDAIFKRNPRGAVIPVQLTGTYYDPHAGVEIVPKKR